MVKSKNKNKTPKDKTAVRMKAAGIPPIIRKGEWEHNTPKKKKAENLEKRYTKAVTQIVACAKEGAFDRVSVLNTVKSALSKAGVK